MKKLFLTCMVLSLVFTIGCQESSITDPTQPLDKNYGGADVNHNIIGLNYEIVDPCTEGFCQLTGQVTYETTIVSPGNIGRKYVNVRLEMVALLCPSRDSAHPLRWPIEKKTEDRVLLSDTDPQTKTLYKTYSICNRDEVELIVAYLITSNSVKVTRVFLQLNDVQN